MATFAGRESRANRPRVALAIGVVVGLSLIASACGASAGSKVAQLSTTNSANSSRSSNTSRRGDARAFSACMRSHGVPNFPDPDSSGHIKLVSGRSANGQTTGVDVNSSQFKRADKACRKFQPNGAPSAAQQAREQQAMLRFAQCMRSHGVPKFPDPKPGGALVLGNKAGIDPNTPQFRAAQQTCQKLTPGGPMIGAPPSAP